MSGGATGAWRWLGAAWVVALAATLGALFIGEVMGRAPCLLCWWQRILMFPLALILGMATIADDRRGAVYALPLALGGTAVATAHVALIAGWLPRWWIACGAGPSCMQQDVPLLGGVPLPWLSLAAFAGIAGLLAAYLKATRR